VNNNFNCTLAEFQQLDTFAAAYPDTLFFVNSNIKTKKIFAINDHPYMAVITLNPDIWIDEKLVSKLSMIDSDKIAFIRIKYIPEYPKVDKLIQKVSKDYPVMITLQRFNGKNSIVQFVPEYREHYEFSHNRFRLFGDSLGDVKELAMFENIYICDEKGLGCGGCGLCSTLVTGRSLPIYTLNLSSSGMCPFNCVDCYAKTMQHFLSKIGVPEIHYDWIHMNHKQSGHTKHIKDCKKKK
jgi:hypothetical protein